MIGTIVNCLAIVFGSFIGLFIRGGMKPRYRDILMSVLGLSVVFIGISTALGGMLKAGTVYSEPCDRLTYRRNAQN